MGVCNGSCGQTVDLGVYVHEERHRRFPSLQVQQNACGRHWSALNSDDENWAGARAEACVVTVVRPTTNAAAAIAMISSTTAAMRRPEVATRVGVGVLKTEVVLMMDPSSGRNGDLRLRSTERAVATYGPLDGAGAHEENALDAGLVLPIYSADLFGPGAA